MIDIIHSGNLRNIGDSTTLVEKIGFVNYVIGGIWVMSFIIYLNVPYL